MRLAPLKYLIVIFMLGIFLARGVVSISPLYALLNYSTTEQEFLMNAEEEKNSEKNNGKTLSEKEFLNELNSSYLVAPAYTVLAGKILLSKQHYIQDVFLPINTPPPRRVID